MKNKKPLIIIIILFLIFSTVGLVKAGNVKFQVFSSGPTITRNIKSKTEIKFHKIVKQKYDVSCGSASLATIFQYYYNDEISEQEIINIIKNIKNIDTLKNSAGFTLLDLKMAAEFLGYKAYGLKGDIKAIRKLDLPIIVLLNSPKGPHFVVIKEVKTNSVKIADPALGNLNLSIEKFKSQWNKTLLAIESKNSIGNNNFSSFEKPNLPQENHIFNLIENNWTRLPKDHKEF
ncbi:MAG TPA: C39 family peptidase [Halanaerobiales bacterium]|nr:C39 family peptidase [Halanaerobiales bacterium]